MSDYARAYSEQAFERKLHALHAFERLVAAAKRLHAFMCDPATPLWVKGVCVAALGYLILPTDAASDFIPVLGLADDLAMLTAALTVIASRLREGTEAVVTEE